MFHFIIIIYLRLLNVENLEIYLVGKNWLIYLYYYLKLIYKVNKVNLTIFLYLSKINCLDRIQVQNKNFPALCGVICSSMQIYVEDDNTTMKKWEQHQQRQPPSEHTGMSTQTPRPRCWWSRRGRMEGSLPRSPCPQSLASGTMFPESSSPIIYSI